MPQAHQIRDTLVLKSTGPQTGGCAAGEPQLYFLLPRSPELCHLQPESGRSSGSGSAPGKVQSAGCPRPDHRAPSKPAGKLREGSAAAVSSLAPSGLGGESCPAQPQPSPIAGLAHSVPGSGQTTCSPKLASLAQRLRGRPALPRTGRGTRGTLWDSGWSLAPGTAGAHRRQARPVSPRGATETRSRDRVQPAAGSSGAAPHPAPRRDPDRLDAGLPGRWAGAGRAGSGGRARGSARRPGAKCRWRRRRLRWPWSPRPLGSTPPPPPLPALPPGLPRRRARPRRGSSSPASLPGELPPATSAGARPDPAPARQPRAPPRSYLCAPGEPRTGRPRAGATPPRPARRPPAEPRGRRACAAPRGGYLAQN
ncbi:basic salivary proline-rich protein 2 [Psammomys obesus]|uniref:basic salivary proline-rich protein 2 n=1 Tax=Psammomys obesus TaxID=48139 RepID=UPI0024528BF3|nr:basic salivary proline-rich protein 2 [Psammomys obesus]